MRKESRIYASPEVREMRSYHCGRFNNLVIFNSDRKINLNADYTVSENNSRSTLSVSKPGSHMAVCGIELETVGDRVNDLGETFYANVLDMIFSKAGFDDDFFKLEADCTVHMECISQTFTKSWLRNNYKTFKAMYELFSCFGITTNDTRCGMHVNLDLANFGTSYDKQIENCRKLGYILNKHYDFMKIALNRYGVTTWCPRMNYSVDYWKNTSVDMFPTAHDRCCINFGHVHQSRIEIRLVGGQKNFPCFRNTMETVYFLVDRVKKLSWSDLDDLTKIFSGCNNYVFDRLKTNCKDAGVITQAQLDEIRHTVENVNYL